MSRTALCIVWWDCESVIYFFLSLSAVFLAVEYRTLLDHFVFFPLMSFLLLSQALEERLVRSTSPSLLSATVGQRLLTRLDDGSGCTSPDKVVALWTEEGIHNSRDILQVMDYLDVNCIN